MNCKFITTRPLDCKKYKIQISNPLEFGVSYLACFQRNLWKTKAEQRLEELLD